MNRQLSATTRRRGLARLEKLERHLRKPDEEQSQPNFDFAIFTNSDQPGCGTSGCAAGECPGLWPASWSFHKSSYGAVRPKLRGLQGQGTTASLAKWFAIESHEVWALFIPGYNLRMKSGRELLPTSTTYLSRDAVADRILKFIKHQRRTGGAR